MPLAMLLKNLRYRLYPANTVPPRRAIFVRTFEVAAVETTPRIGGRQKRAGGDVRYSQIPIPCEIADFTDII